MAENRCYDPDCADENCRNPEHYNHICFDPECNEVKCENSDHYDQQLLKEYQENTDLSVHDHSEKIDYDKDVDISLCGCPDCADDDDDDDDDGELLAEGKPLIANRPIQIIVASAILFVLGHVFEFLSFDTTIITATYMLGAVIAGYEIAILAYKSLVKKHTIGPAMLMCIACVASFIIGHPEEGAAVTFLYYIAEFLEDYSEFRARRSIKSLVEKVAKYYTPVMMVAAICVALIPPLALGQNLTDWVYKALSLLVISCPCAFLISTPVGMVSAITSATRNGVIIKGSTYVEEMRNIKAVIFDKTGTLTEGKLKLSDVKVLDESYSKEDIVRIAASLESESSHPIAQAVVDYANDENISSGNVEEFKNVPGKGIVANIDGEQYYAANESLIDGSSFDISRDEINSYAEGKTVIFIGNARNVIGIITVSDKIRDNASEVIEDLKGQGVQTVMLTGDNKLAAKSVASEIGIDYVYSDLLPQDKLNLLDTVRNKFGDVAMVGDGINDAPALARANIGIAMGAAGSDVAIETADVALMQDDISKLPYLFALSHKTMGIIKQNISLAITIKLLCAVLAIVGIITLMMSVGVGDLGLTLLVILNSFRIGMVKDPLF